MKQIRTLMYTFILLLPFSLCVYLETKDISLSLFLMIGFTFFFWIIFSIGMLEKRVSQYFIWFENSTFSNVLSFSSLFISILLAVVGILYTFKFSPVDMTDIQPTKEAIFLTKENSFFPTHGLNVSNITSNISGAYKEIFIGTIIPLDDNKKSLVLESLLTTNKQEKNGIFVNLVNIDTGIKDIPNISPQPTKILFFYGDKPKVNHIFLVVEDYNGNKNYIMYVLSINSEKNQSYLNYYPLKEKDLYSTNTLYALYEKIDFSNDIFWKEKRIEDMHTFKEYLIQSFKQFKQTLEKD
ncbi:hypothetical protein GMA11_06250 [Granulicatella sp. zg-ZJ]|uniref:hypothetical protein n=1 Tax=Granulicatella sp. zg-ZJ TaxID=2678504 RepID=UPI0013D85016|nr:hypothetical protein [Granulicatella sp. zg-ZJ]NEW62447.1 hypothetical protein [Granulicatella sp. zg-ZJ]NEW62993.1 hypothetical protein [Granulicatella sp. zg-ZJ]